MLVDRCADLASRLVLEPRLEDGAVRSSIRADPVDDEFVVECDDVGSTHPGHSRHDADPVETATERDAAAIAGTAAGCDPPSDLGLTAEMLAEPGLTLREERGSTTLVLGPDGPGRDRDDDASLGMDDDP